MSSSRVAWPGRVCAPAPGRVTKLIAVGGLLALPLMTAMIQTAVQFHPGYSNMRDMISHLSTPGSAYSAVVNATFMIQGILVGAFGIALGRLLGGRLALMATTLFFIYTLANIGAGVFQNDNGARIVAALTADALHDRLAQTGAASISLGILAVVAAVWRDPRWAGVALLGVFAVAINSVLSPLIVFEYWDGYHGLFERVMFGGTLGWVMLASYRVLRMPGKGNA